MKKKRGRLEREKRTVEVMIRLYCRKNHGGELCDECRALEKYAVRRIERCRYGSDKPVCAKCATHCYKPEMREKIREVMRFSGPRMIYRHPVLAISHLTDGRHLPEDRP